MFNGWLISYVLKLVVSELASVGAKFDWSAFMVTWDKALALFLPGDIFDADAIGVLNAFISRLQAVLQATDKMNALLQAVVDKNWTVVLQDLKDWLLDGWMPANVHEAKALSALRNYEVPKDVA